MPKDSSVVGDLINFRGLVYSPMNENGVIYLFGKVTEDLHMYIEEIKPGFPDCCLHGGFLSIQGPERCAKVCQNTRGPGKVPVFSKGAKGQMDVHLNRELSDRFTKTEQVTSRNSGHLLWVGNDPKERVCMK